LLSYEGPFGVGYAVAAFKPAGEAQERNFGEQYSHWRRESAKAKHALEGEYASLARLSLETYVRTGKKVKLPENLPEQMLNTKAGVFVTIKKEGRLRGCIGTISPVKDCVGAEILTNAISAGLDDTRFDPVTEDELNELSFSVDVLEAPEPISSEAELDPKTYGVIVSAGYRRGLLLPNISGIDTAQEQVAIAKRKAGIRDEDKAKLERFKVTRHT
ncbi:MAG TPA: AmmeMemoRadiSam system protein A, partial [Clostridia bacterium]|nr:AmmeMemoRadiSam system protein A [Clostridia bacterium]